MIDFECKPFKFGRNTKDSSEKRITTESEKEKVEHLDQTIIKFQKDMNVGRLAKLWSSNIIDKMNKFKMVDSIFD